MDLLRVKSEVIAGHKAQQHVVGMSASGYLWLSLDCVLDRAQPVKSRRLKKGL